MSERPTPVHPLTVAGATAFPARIAASDLTLDTAQTAAVERLTRPTVHGVYLWGPVGRGKSVLAEQYVASLPTGRVLRVHFHEWFRALQAEVAGGVRPLSRAVGRLLGSARVVLFDEFHVHDVADAIYLDATLRTILERRILFVATSNFVPEDLLPDPLHHDRFLPTIDLIRSTLEVVAIGEGRDYRRGADLPLHGTWRATEPGEPVGSDVELRPNGLPVHAVSAAGSDAVFTFAELCDRPIWVREYLWVAERFRRVRVIEMPDPARILRNPMQRFGSLVEVLHDRGVALDVEAAGEPERIESAPVPPRDAARVLSRLALLRRL